MRIFRELKLLSRKSPIFIRIITLYNIINFLSTLFLWLFGIIITFYITKNDHRDYLTFSHYLYSIIFLVINFLTLKVNLKLILGSNKAYWILLLLFLIQCFEIELSKFGFSIALGGIPIKYIFSNNLFFVGVNIPAILITAFHLFVLNKYKLYCFKIKKK